MSFRAAVVAGCFCLVMLGAASGASAQSALPNGYTIPNAATRDLQSGPTLVAPQISVFRRTGKVCGDGRDPFADDFDPYDDTYDYRLSDDGLFCEWKICNDELNEDATHCNRPDSGDDWGDYTQKREQLGPADYCANWGERVGWLTGAAVDAIDPVTGAVSCRGNDSCYLGAIDVDVIAGGKHASFSGREDCALRPKGCVKENGEPERVPIGCSFTGRATTTAMTVTSCWDGDRIYIGLCLRIPRTAANAKKRRVSTVASWKVSLNGESIGAGRMRVTTTYTPAVKGRPGKRIYIDTNFWTYYNYCLSLPDSQSYRSNGRLYCWWPGTKGRKAKWTDEAKRLSGS